MKKILVIGGSGYVGKNLGLTIPNKYLLKTYCKNKNNNFVFFDLCRSKLDDINIDYKKKENLYLKHKDHLCKTNFAVFCRIDFLLIFML